MRPLDLQTALAQFETLMCLHKATLAAGGLDPETRQAREKGQCIRVETPGHLVGLLENYLQDIKQVLDREPSEQRAFIAQGAASKIWDQMEQLVASCPALAAATRRAAN